jgi:hypothetical protein
MSSASHSELDFDGQHNSESLALQDDFIFTEPDDKKGNESMHNSMWQQMNAN